MTYKTLEDLAKGIYERMEALGTDDEAAIKADPELCKIADLWMAYVHAQEAAEREGYVGVGCITYAEKHMQKLQEVTK